MLGRVYGEFNRIQRGADQTHRPRKRISYTYTLVHSSKMPDNLLEYKIEYKIHGHGRTPQCSFIRNDERSD